jgi:hypothetical protein
MEYHMASPDYLTGLMKWLKRPEWASGLEEVLQEHIGVVCEAADLEHEDLEELIGEQDLMVLVACAVEDFLTRSRDQDGRNVVVDYLKRRGWKESVTNKRYMLALRDSEMSLYEISDIVPGQSFRARDLVRDRPPVLVFEQEATRELQPLDHIATRIIELNGKRIISGGTLQFDPAVSEELLEKIRAAKVKLSSLLKELPADLDEPFDAAAKSELLNTMAMALAPPLISAMWLEDALDQVMDEDEPEAVNSDGDDILFHDIRFPLLPGVSTHAARTRLNGIGALRPEADGDLWNWVAPRDPAMPGAAHRPLGVDTELDDGILLGTIRLNETEVGCRTNSAERAARGRELLASALDGLAGMPVTEIETLDDVIHHAVDEDSADDMDEDPTEATPANTEISPEAKAEFLQTMLKQHYRRLLNEAVAMLGGISPREAARTDAGRKKLVAWLKELESGAAGHRAAGNPLGTYDFGWMWTELGVEDMRK